MKLKLLPSIRAMRAFTRDHSSGLFTFDAAKRRPVMDSSPLWPQRNGRKLEMPVDPGVPLYYGAGPNGVGVITHDGKTVDSSGAFLVGELERLDLTMHEPLVDVTWSRDIQLREDVTIADDVSSFTLTTFASAGSLGTGAGIGTGKAWIGKTADQIAGISVDISKIPHNLTPWGMELKFTIFELEQAAKVGRPIDSQKYEGLQLKDQMDTDEQVYIGDTSLGQTGLLNDAGVTPANVANGAAGSPLWTQKTPDEILTDINTMITTVWTTAAYAVIPNELRLPPVPYGYLTTQKVSAAGNVSILKYILENNVLTATGRGKLNIQPLKWCVGAGAGGTIGTEDGHDRALVYTNDKKRVRFPMTMLQRTPVQFNSIYHMTTYFKRLGQIEMVYPQTVGYFDGFA